MIELGLARISRLLRDTPIPWSALHVAGTNGKGSVCAYASAMLHASGVKCGRFTSPHLIDRWDCITIQERIVSPHLFRSVEATVQAYNNTASIGASEFEILTATAFEIFRRLDVEIGVVEVGLGGSQDATNVLQSPAATVITKIGYDHQSYLGNSIEEIALHKAGIIKPHTPCFVDGSNEPSVLEVLRRQAKDRLASFVPVAPGHPQGALKSISLKLDGAPHQVMNLQLALESVQAGLRTLGKEVPLHQLLKAAEETSWPGRLEFISLKTILQSERKVLLDGAHNAQAAEALGSFVDRKVRRGSSSVLWLVGISHDKDAYQLLAKLLRPGDSLVATDFGMVEGMPWVRPMDPHTIVEAAQHVCSLSQALACGGNVQKSLLEAARSARANPIVVAGSLYLVSEILRLKRDGLGTV